MNKLTYKKVSENLLLLLSLMSALYCTYLALFYANQPLLDYHSFRQTQTALSAYWFLQEGFKFAYETPVAGIPWSIPFEFPIYQALVAFVCKLFPLPLDVAGRVISYLFLLFCLIPTRSITKKLDLSEHVFYAFVAILFSSPIYVYWGRAFLIETAALFFAITAIKYFVDGFIDKFSFQTMGLFVVFMTLSVLQKSTTGLPVLVFLSALYIFFEITKMGSIHAFLFRRRSWVILMCLVVPVVAGAIWVFYTDHVKALNPFGEQITSSSLSLWNLGSIKQRYSSELYVKLLWRRIFSENLAGYLGLSLLLITIFSKCHARLKIVVFFASVLGVFPLFVFTNLHIVHEYYQTASVIFLIYAVAVVLAGVVAPAIGEMSIAPVLVLIMISNYANLFENYLPQIKLSFNKENRDLAIADILNRELPKESQFVVFGNDWSSTLAYMSQRKSFSVPAWFKQYEKVKNYPEIFVEKGRLGAVVACSTENPNLTELIKFSSHSRDWKIAETHGCYIAIPQQYLSVDKPSEVPCQGHLDPVHNEHRQGSKILRFSGWVTSSSTSEIAPEHVFVVLSQLGQKPIYFEALRVPRLDMNAKLKISNTIDIGFSRIILANLAPGEYDVGLVYSQGEQVVACSQQQKLFLN